MSFWLDAVLTRQYLLNRLPTSTLPDDTTPFELITGGRKPDLSHLRIWGCDCYVAVPNEIHGKAGPKRFRAIFVGYEEHRVGWRVRSLDGRYSFSNDVVFNENLAGRLGPPRQLSSASDVDSLPLSPRALRVRPCVCTSAGKKYDEVLRLKAFRKAERDKSLPASFPSVNGGANGGAAVITSLAACSVDLSPSALAITYLSSLISSPSSLAVSDASSLHGDTLTITYTLQCTTNKHPKSARAQRVTVT